MSEPNILKNSKLNNQTEAISNKTSGAVRNVFSNLSLNQHPNKAGDSQIPGFPFTVEIKQKDMPERGIKIIADDIHLKTISNRTASFLVDNRIILYCTGKRLNDMESDYIIYQKYLYRIGEAFKLQNYKTIIPEKVFRNIVRVRDDGTIYFTITLQIRVNNRLKSFSHQIKRPEFKNLKCQARINNRYLADNYKEISPAEVKKELKRS